jgi:hypothetical protein
MIINTTALMGKSKHKEDVTSSIKKAMSRFARLQLTMNFYLIPLVCNKGREKCISQKE